MPAPDQAPVIEHATADFLGVASKQLGDAAALTALMIAAAGAAGLSTMGAPIVRQLPSGGIAAILVLDGCHLSVHTIPQRELLLLDVLVVGGHDARKAVDVFTRKLVAREVRSGTHRRG
jgi:S-adenosylmethionine/arginine decarboxylase-like enzyme